MNAKKLSGMQIMVVDDEPDLRDLLCGELEYHGAKTINAKNGEDALAKLRGQATKVDVIVSDVRMAGGDGIKLVDWVKNDEKLKHIKIFLVTGFADLSLETAKRKGVEDLLGKPIDWDLLVEKIAKALEKRI